MCKPVMGQSPLPLGTAQMQNQKAVLLQTALNPRQMGENKETMRPGCGLCIAAA